jgi:hypothetical protein
MSLVSTACHRENSIMYATEEREERREGGKKEDGNKERVEE